MPDCCENVGSIGKWIQMLHPLAGPGRSGCCLWPPASKSPAIQSKGTPSCPGMGVTRLFPLNSVLFCSALWFAGNLQQECQLSEGFRWNEQEGESPWANGSGWLLPGSLCAGRGLEAAQPEGKKTSPSVVVEHKARGGVSHVWMYTWVFFFSYLSTFSACLSSSGAILKCLKIERCLSLHHSLPPLLPFPSLGE